VGGKDLIKRSWKDLSDYVTLICDGVNLTSRLTELRPHVLLFLNIPKYSAGTVPWGHSSDPESQQRIDDKKIEVIGLTTASLATLQMGGHGDRICQCSEVQLTTRKVIPMQVDGEPCRLGPSIITIKLRNQAFVVQKSRRIDGSSPAHYLP
uniref:DAGKa domain-containing protein n=1 Tax=Mesocestoides corti TaxID=53468 RepID=A0A5K3FSW3_MESCO